MRNETKIDGCHDSLSREYVDFIESYMPAVRTSEQAFCLGKRAEHMGETCLLNQPVGLLLPLR